MKTVRMLFGLFLVGSVIFLAWKVVPAYFANYQFEEAVDDTARSAAVDSRKGPDEIRSAVLEKAQSYELPVKAEDIDVTRNGSDVLISVEYVVHVDVPVYPFDMKFNPSSKRQGLSFK